MRYLRFCCKNGEVWGLPLSKVAEHRAEHYAESDHDTTFEEEFEYVMRDSFEGLDWFRNNCNPDDFSESSYFLVSRAQCVNFYDMINESEVYIAEINEEELRGDITPDKGEE